MLIYPIIIEALDEVVTIRKSQGVYKHLLENLLAIIHRDGGHYTHKHGLEKAVKDAKEEIVSLRAEIHRLHTTQDLH
jgi:hypothetical protein